MSPNVEIAQEATRLFVSQLRIRPENVLANVNCLIEGENFRLELVPLHREPQTPQEASLFDWQHHSPQEQIAIEEAAHAASD